MDSSEKVVNLHSWALAEQLVLMQKKYLQSQIGLTEREKTEIALRSSRALVMALEKHNTYLQEKVAAEEAAKASQ